MIDTLRSAAHLQREIGNVFFTALVSSDNTEAVRKFTKSLPITLTIGDRVYDSLSFLRGDEKSVRGPVMVDRSKEMNAHLGKEEGEYLLEHQGDIPEELRGEIVFVFTDWRHPDDSEHVYYVYWSGRSQYNGLANSDSALMNKNGVK